MSFTLIGHDFNAQTSGTPCSLTIGSVNAGDLAFIATYVTNTASVLTVGDGSSTFTPLTNINATSTFAKMRGYYCLASAASGSVTYTMSASPDTTKGIFVWVFRPSGTATFDVDGTGDQTGVTTVNLNSNITTTGTDEVAIGACLADSFQGGATPTSLLINGVSALASDTDFFKATAWYTAPNATFTGMLQATISPGAQALSILATFKNTANAGLLVMQRTVLDYID